MVAEAVVRVQLDEEQLARMVGRAFEGHRDHVKAQALRDFAAELQTLALAVSQEPPSPCVHQQGCRQAGRFSALADVSRLAYERAAQLEAS